MPDPRARHASPLHTGCAPQRSDLVRRELTPLSGVEPDQPEARVPSPVEALHRKTDSGAHAFHLVLAAFVHGQLDPAHTCAASYDASLGRCRSPILEVDAMSKRRERIG